MIYLSVVPLLKYALLRALWCAEDFYGLGLFQYFIMRVFFIIIIIIL